MKDDPHFEAQRLVWRFKRSGDDGVACRPFADFPPEVREAVNAEANVGNHEAPALLCRLADDRWALLTTRRVVWRTCDEGLRSIDLSRVVDATVDADAMLRAGRKLGLKILTIVADDGSQHQIELESGPSFFGFWNAVKAASGG